MITAVSNQNNKTSFKSTSFIGNFSDDAYKALNSDILDVSGVKFSRGMETHIEVTQIPSTVGHTFGLAIYPLRERKPDVKILLRIAANKLEEFKNLNLKKFLTDYLTGLNKKSQQKGVPQIKALKDVIAKDSTAGKLIVFDSETKDKINVMR